MNKRGYILAVSLMFLGLAVSAQTYDQVFGSNFWNMSENITGVRQDTVSRSYAEAYGKYAGGGFHDTWQAPEGWSAGAVTASIRHLEKMSLAGSFSFEQTEGYGVCGSMFSRPGFYPVDLLEFTPGRKTMQIYALDGGISYDIADSWRIGVKGDFESANLTKKKDLRHSNWRLDMTISPGFMYHKNNFAIGASYVFRKTGETVEAEQVGTAESSYYAFLDKGMMYGIYSVWSGSGLHLSEAGVKGFPVKDFSNGAAVQMQYKGFFAEIGYLHTQGTVGEKEYIWFRFPGNEAGITLGYSHKGEKSEHQARIALEHKGLKLDENILEKVSENGVTTVYNHGSNRILADESLSLNPEYEFASRMMEIHVGGHLNWRNTVSSQMYPYAYSESLMAWNAEADILLHLGPFDLGVRAGTGKGNETEELHIVDETSGVQTTPYRLQEWYDRQIEYQTALRADAGLSLRYNFRKGIYLQAEGSWTHGFGLKYIAGTDRFGTALRIGYNF